MTIDLDTRPATVPISDLPDLIGVTSRFVRWMLDHGELGDIMPEPTGDVILRSELDDLLDRKTRAAADAAYAFTPEGAAKAERSLLSRASGVSLERMDELGF
jgi:hypothetical protein